MHLEHQRMHSLGLPGQLAVSHGCTKLYMWFWNILNTGSCSPLQLVMSVDSSAFVGRFTKLSFTWSTLKHPEASWNSRAAHAFRCLLNPLETEEVKVFRKSGFDQWPSVCIEVLNFEARHFRLVHMWKWRNVNAIACSQVGEVLIQTLKAQHILLAGGDRVRVVVEHCIMNDMQLHQTRLRYLCTVFWTNHIIIRYYTYNVGGPATTVNFNIVHWCPLHVPAPFHTLPSLPFHFFQCQWLCLLFVASVLWDISLPMCVKNVEVLWDEVAISIRRGQFLQLVSQPSVQVISCCVLSFGFLSFILGRGTKAFPAASKFADGTLIRASHHCKGHVAFVGIIQEKARRDMPPLRLHASGMGFTELPTMILHLCPALSPLQTHFFAQLFQCSSSIFGNMQQFQLFQLFHLGTLPRALRSLHSTGAPASSTGRHWQVQIHCIKITKNPCSERGSNMFQHVQTHDITTLINDIELRPEESENV